MELKSRSAVSQEPLSLIIRKWAAGLTRRTLIALAIVALASGCGPYINIMSSARNLPRDQLVLIHGTNKFDLFLFPFPFSWLGKHVFVYAVDGQLLYPEWTTTRVSSLLGIAPGKHNLSYKISFGLCVLAGSGLIIQEGCFRMCRDTLDAEVEAGKEYVLDADTTPTPIEVVLKEKETEKVVAKGECKCSYTFITC